LFRRAPIGDWNRSSERKMADTLRLGSGSKLLQNFGLLNAVNSCNRIENGIQRSEPQSLVLGNSNAVRSRSFRLKKDVAPKAFGASSANKHLVTHQMKPHLRRFGLVEKVGRNRFLNIFPQLVPVVSLCKNIV
jgi:hypothetical protein